MVRTIFLLTVVIIAASCGNTDDNRSDLPQTSITDCGCDTLWSDSTSIEFVTILEQTTSSNQAVWMDYKLGDAAIVLNAGGASDTAHCLGLWKNGKAISFSCSKDIPEMLTSLYSYYLNYENPVNIDSTFFRTIENAPEFSAWMELHDIETAVYMPTEFPQFPFEIPAKVKTQLAVHEAFHIEVMLRYWYTKKGYWPEWDEQPDRSQLPTCYTYTDSIQILTEREQKTLSLMIESLLDTNSSEAVRLGDEFIKTREARYESLDHVLIELDDQTSGHCRDAEAIMEIEEGIADYASWVKMYDIGVVSREDLLQRYRAIQKDRFYLTGCMLLHASALMNDGDDSTIIAKMVNSNSLEEGSLFTLFKEQLMQYRQF